MASVPVYCLCRLPYDVTRFMIECDVCQDWFHGSCVGVEEEKATEIDLYHCPNCQVSHGPSVMRRRRGSHKQEAHSGAAREAGRPVKTGSPQFIRELRGRTFPSADEVLLRPSGAQLTVEFLEERSFSVPVLVLRRDGLGMSLPPPSFSVSDVQHYIGEDKEIDVIDVVRQADLKMPLGEFVQYYNSPNRQRVLNVISLEFSETRYGPGRAGAGLSLRLSWVENLWPEESAFERPNVQKYCLMGVKDSYTDFHIDFGGTSVWYHVLRGEKIFYLIRPTPANLALFERWSSSSNQNELFFGDQVDHCYKCAVKQGNTLFIPTGWIHAVLTPVDCLAFGGNFLHSLNIDMQLRAYEIEKRLSTADLFKFPNFETVCWYVGKHLLDTFRGLRENRRHPAAYLVHGAKALNNAFRTWTRKEALPEHEEEIPETIKTQQLVKELAKEIRLVEVSPDALTDAHSLNDTLPDSLKLELPASCLDDLEGKLNKSKLRLVLTNGKILGKKGSRSGGATARFQPLTGQLEGAVGGGSDTEDELQIDETPPRRHRATPPSKKRLAVVGSSQCVSVSPSVCLSVSVSVSQCDVCVFQEDYTTDEEALTLAEVKAGGPGGAGGILDLLKASKQVAGLDCAALSEDAPASPSTRDAIQGMLSMANPPSSSSSTSSGGGASCGGGAAGSSQSKAGLIQRPGKRPIKRPARHHSDAEESLDEQETLGTCFKDSEFIYPSLESDEEDHALKSKAKRKKNSDDTPWNPKARVTPTLPRQERPVREGVRVASVETGLAAAAAKLTQQVELGGNSAVTESCRGSFTEQQEGGGRVI
ncbi:PHF8 demethylase, partial [Amia calva]|nr:PHF8 demethylase [Amia calva]